jgi:VCBS repeat-containing protein
VRKKILILELEPRIMFDAAGASSVEVHADASSTPSDTHLDSAPLLALYSESFNTSAKVSDAFAKAKEQIASFMSDPESFSQIAPVFALDTSVQESERYQTLLSRIAEGSYSVELKILDAETMGMAECAYAANGPEGTPIIYVNGDWAAGAESAELQRVLIEEIGHSFDTVLNGTNDSPGDEGERFAVLVTTGILDETVGTDNDRYTMSVDGQKLDVELATFNFVNAYAMVYDLNNNGSVVGSTGETAAAKEQNSHNFNTVSLGAAKIDDSNYNSALFSGNDVSAIGINIGGETYYGWVSRPIKAGGIIRGFYFWTDADFTDLATAQADGNQDGDGTTNDNKGFLLVVDQGWFDSQIASSSHTVTLNNSFDGNLGTITYSNIGSSSDRVDSALNSLITANTAPAASNDTCNGTNGTTAAVEAGYNVPTQNGTGNVLTNDTDADSDTLTVTKIGISSTQLNSVSSGTTSTSGTSVIGKYGTLTLGSDGSYKYVVDNTNSTVDALPTGGTLNDTFTYSISDGKGGSSIATLTVVINGANDAPTANPDYNIAKESTTSGISGFNYTGYTATGDVTLNDTDADDAESTKNIVGTVLTGTATGTTGSVGGGVTTLSFSTLPANVGVGYYVFDDGNDTLDNKTPGTLFLNANNNAITIASIDTVNKTFTLSGAVANATITDNQILGFANSTAGAAYKDAQITTSVTSGISTVNLSGYTGSIAVGMSVTGGELGTGVTVMAVNYSGSTLQSIVINSTTSLSNASLTFQGYSAANTVLQGQHGQLLLNANGTYTYTPTTDNTLLSEGESAVEVFDYTMQDSQGVTSSSKLYITVYGTGSNDPVLTNDTGTATETGVQPNGNTAESGSNATGNVLTNDTAGAGGIVSAFSKADGSGTVNAGSSIIGSYGSLVINGDGTYTYTVDNANATVNSMLAGQTLSETFIYNVTNTAGGNSFAKLTITINGTNDQIIAVNNTAAVQEDVTLSASDNVMTNDTDVDSGDTKIVSKAGTSSADTAVSTGTTSSNGLSVVGIYGTLIIGEDGTYSYTLNNSSTAVQSLAMGETVYDTFMYEVKDTDGSTSTATLSVTVTGNNESPVNSYPSTVTIDQNTDFSFTGANAITVSDVDTTGSTNWVALNVDHGTLAFSSAPSGVTLSGSGTGTLRITGTLSDINAALVLLKYTPSTDFYGTDYMTITSQDTNSANDSDSIAITVAEASLNDAPTASDTTITTNEDTAKTATLPAATDIDGDSVTYAKATDPSHGTVTVNADGTYTYTPAANYSGSDSFTYTVSDGNGGSNTYSVTITVNPVNDAPKPEVVTEKIDFTPISEKVANSTSSVLSTDQDFTPSVTLREVIEQSNIMDTIVDVEIDTVVEESDSLSSNENDRNFNVTETGRLVLEFEGQREVVKNDLLEVRAFQMDSNFVRIVVKDSTYSEGEAKFEMYALNGREAPSWLQIDSETGLITGTPPKATEIVVVQVKVIGKDGKVKTVDVEINIVKKSNVALNGTLSRQLDHYASVHYSDDALINLLKMKKEA